MAGPLIECVTNFSEGRDASTVRAIEDAIASLGGEKVAAPVKPPPEVVKATTTSATKTGPSPFEMDRLKNSNGTVTATVFEAVLTWSRERH